MDPAAARRKEKHGKDSPADNTRAGTKKRKGNGGGGGEKKKANSIVWDEESTDPSLPPEEDQMDTVLEEPGQKRRYVE